MLRRLALLWEYAGKSDQVPVWVLLTYLGLLLVAIATAIGVFSVRARRRGLPSYERFIAWRYLREAHTAAVEFGASGWVAWLARWRRWGLVLALVLLGGSLGLHVYLEQTERIGADAIFQPPTQVELILSQVRYVLLGVGLVALVIGLLRLVFSVFTTISIFGVCLGTTALIVVLSVMSGFEADLKRKILGTYAHVIVSADDPIPDYESLVDEIRKVPGVVAAAPYLENEAMAASVSNMSGILVRGVDPKAVVNVTDLDKSIRYGKFEHLSSPEKIEKEESFRPLTAPPLPLPLADGGVPLPGLGDGGAAAPAPGGPDGGAAGAEEWKLPGAPGAPARRRGAEGAAGDAAADPLKDFPPRGDRPARPGVIDEDPTLGRPIPSGPVGLVKALPGAEPRKDLPGIIVGRELSKNLRILVGDEVHVVSPQGDIGPTGPIPKSRLFRVAAVFYSGMYEYDTKFVYVTIPVAQNFFRQRGRVTGVEVKTGSLDLAHDVARRIERRLAELPALKGVGGLKVRSWQELNKNLFSALKLEKAAMFIVLTFIVLVASFSIVCNLIMVVLEKGREIAILKSMGANDRSVLRIFVLQGLYIGIIGVSIGLCFGLGICVYLKAVGLALDPDVYYISRLPVMVKEWEIATVALASVGLSLLATLYPALTAAKLGPVDGLRFQ